MKKSIFLALCAALFAQFSCTSTPQDQITVQIDGWRNDTVFIDYAPVSGEGTVHRDTVVAVEGRFGCSIALEAPSFVTVWRKKDHFAYGQPYLFRSIQLLMLPQETVQVQGTAEREFLNYQVEGSPVNMNIAEYRRLNKSALLRSDSLQTIELDAHLRRDTRELERIGAEWQANNEEVLAADLRFIRERPEADWSLHLLLKQPADTITAYLPLLAESVKAGVFKARLEKKMAAEQEFQLTEEAGGAE